MSGLVPPRSRALGAEIASIRIFGFPLLSRTMVVQRDRSGLDPLAQARVLLRVVNLDQHRYRGLRRIAGGLPVIDAPQIFPGNRGRPTTAITYLFFRPDVGLSLRDLLAHKFARLRVDQPGDALVGVTGAVPGRLAQGREIRNTLPLVELITVLVVVTIVAWHYRSAVAPLITLLAAAVSFAITERAVPWALGRLGVATPTELEPILVALLLGIVTDYSIFFLSGLRNRLAAGDEPLPAAQTSVADVAPIVLTAGLTVAAGAGSLLLSRLGAFRGLGPGLALTVLMGMLVSVTLVPATMALLGRLAFWPSVPVEGAGEPTRTRHAPTRWVARRNSAAVVAVLCLASLGILGAEIRHLRPSFSVITDLPAGTEVRRAATAAGRGFAPGVTSPTMLVLRGPRARNVARLIRLQDLLQIQPGVAVVLGPREVSAIAGIVDRLPEGRLRNRLEGEADRVLRAVVSERHRAARLMMILDHPALSADAVETIRRLVATTPSLLDRADLPGVRFAYAGDTALASETIRRTVSDLIRIALVVVVIDLMILAVFLRSLVAPLYLLVTSLLGFLAGLGLTDLAFRTFGGTTGMSIFVPFASAVLLVSLGSDYNIFLVGQVWEEARRSSLHQGLVVAAPRASRAIAAAGITLTFSFAVLALVPLTSFREFAVVMATGIVLDTFVVRTFLVPAMITLVGRASAWPARFHAPGATVSGPTPPG
ncbi:MAG TPA: MMPL family transporter [Actinomycetota bacterium]|nr:MMPL family transporter [Actinomycetota bacterium]